MLAGWPLVMPSVEAARYRRSVERPIVCNDTLERQLGREPRPKWPIVRMASATSSSASTPRCGWRHNETEDVHRFLDRTPGPCLRSTGGSGTRRRGYSLDPRCLRPVESHYG